MKLKTALLAVMTTVGFLPAAFAEKDRGGGDGVWGCAQSKLGDFGFNQIFFANTVVGDHRKVMGLPVMALYDFGLKTSRRSAELEALFVSLLFAEIASKRPQEAEEVRSALDRLRFVAEKPSHDGLPKLETGLRLSLPQRFGHCSRRQIAIQNFSTNEVLYDTTALQMSPPYLRTSFGPLARAFFRVHEGYLKWLHEKGVDLKGSEKVSRAVALELARSKEFSRKVVETVYANGAKFDLKQFHFIASLRIDHSSWMIPGLMNGPSSAQEIKALQKMLRGLAIPCTVFQRSRQEVLEQVDHNFRGDDGDFSFRHYMDRVEVYCN